MFDNPRKDDPASLQAIPTKANQVLHLVLCVLALIGLRIWHLAIIQHDKKVEEAFQPRRKTIIEPAARGTIRDRNNIVLAANTMEYRLSIVYSQFRDVPAVLIEKGSKRRRLLRREYIHQLARTVSNVLSIDAGRLEDLIHSHASLNYNIPLIIKRGLTEEQYYRLKLLEKDWVGIQVQAVPKRYYPRGRSAAGVIGYLGPISREKYTALIAEIRLLSEYVQKREMGQDIELPEGIATFAAAKRRLLKLTEMAYTINDTVGLAGIEASFEQELRGYSGRNIFFSDAKGNRLRYLPGSRPATPGKRVLLSLSIELQEFAEKLLAQSEIDREGQREGKEPLMRGGAVVVLDPNTFEVLTLASYPRYDPNDFIRAKASFFDDEMPTEVLRWLENESYLAKVWNQELPLKRELFSKKGQRFLDEEHWLTWKYYLRLILDGESPIRSTLSPSTPIRQVAALQRRFVEAKEANPECTNEEIVDNIDLGPISAREKLLLLDLSYLVLDQADFSDQLLKKVGSLTIEEFRTLQSTFVRFSQQIKNRTLARWKKNNFTAWREAHEKEFLLKKRQEEKLQKLSVKPYLDYLDREEKEQFELFWQEMKYDVLASQVRHNTLLAPALKELQGEELISFLSTLKGFTDLRGELLGRYNGLKTQKEFAAVLLAAHGTGHMRSLAYSHGAIQGSLFKLVTAYAALKQRYEETKEHPTWKDFSLFEINDHTYRQEGRTFVGNFASGQPIPQLYRGGRIPKSLSAHIGKMDLLKAIERSSNPYFSLIAGDFLKDPLQLNMAAQDFGYAARTGIALPGEIAGKLPNDLETNRTGIYSFAIGQHTLLATPLQTAAMLGFIANGGERLTPRIASLVIGKETPFVQKPLEQGTSFPFDKSLRTVGIGFPLFSKVAAADVSHEVVQPEQKKKEPLFFPLAIKNFLVEGMRRVFKHLQADRSSLMSSLYKTHPEMHESFVAAADTMVGKTGTAESQERIGINFGQATQMYNHTWFGGISYPKPISGLNPHSFVLKDCFGRPELVVVVYLRYGGYGKQVAPLAAQIVKKWKEINNTNI
ncbi:MAG: hypothetical protein JSR46_10545 [Verrucomicrobia bacterium]|nr:hypothetical protein [Verrucomicrobiota bacterium]